MRETRARVISLEEMSRAYRRLILDVDWDEYQPGQFVMVRVPGGAAFVRRPFGIVNLAEGKLEICFKVVGDGTRALAAMRAGDELYVVGPLGHGFEAAQEGTHVLVAGGYGIAPIVGLARRLAAHEQHVVLFYGAKNKDHLLYQRELHLLPIDVHMATEDGSVGTKGMIIGVVAHMIDAMAKPTIYACGPKPLMEAVASLGAKRDVMTQVSLDEYMACGIGVCLGCVCTTKDGAHVRACREGPVFEAKEIAW